MTVRLGESTILATDPFFRGYGHLSTCYGPRSVSNPSIRHPFSCLVGNRRVDPSHVGNRHLLFSLVAMLMSFQVLISHIVFTHMVGLVSDDEVGYIVVPLSPVDMVYYLTGEQLSSNVQLHYVPMVKNRNTVDSYSYVPVGTEVRKTVGTLPEFHITVPVPPAIVRSTESSGNVGFFASKFNTYSFHNPVYHEKV